MGLGTAVCAAGEIDPDLAGRLAREIPTRHLPVIVQLAKQPDIEALARRASSSPVAQRGGRLLEQLKAFATPLQAPLLKELEQRKAEKIQPLVTVNAVAALLTPPDIKALAAREDVARIRYDLGLLAPSRRMVADPCKPERPTPRQRLPKHCGRDPAPLPAETAAAFDPARPVSASLAALQVPAAWQAGHTGKGVTVAVVDTGVDAQHADLAASFRGGTTDWFDPHAEHQRPMDRHGHGTQIAGLVLGRGANGQTVGVAPQAKWIAARIYSDRNVGRLSHLHRVMAWLLDPDGNASTADTPQVVLNAWGFGDRIGECSTEFALDLALLRAAGVHMVFAAGNGGPADGTSVSPANNAGVLAVGATNGQGELASFSSRGKSACDARPYPDAVAPGELVRTTDLSAGRVPTSTVVSGTSYAAALAAGELALLVQAKPQAPLAEREAALRSLDPAVPPLVRALALAVALPAASASAAPASAAAKAAP